MKTFPTITTRSVSTEFYDSQILMAGHNKDHPSAVVVAEKVGSASKEGRLADAMKILLTEGKGQLGSVIGVMQEKQNGSWATFANQLLAHRTKAERQIFLNNLEQAGLKGLFKELVGESIGLEPVNLSDHFNSTFPTKRKR